MKKIFVLNGSRQKEGNTTKFVRKIIEKLDKNIFETEFAYPQDYEIRFCVGCHQCFINAKCSIKDEIELLQEKILSADIFIVASPVYLHYMTADLKLILDRFSWWAHTLRLQGKPIVVLSTCSTNGFTTVLEPLCEIMTFMGGNVIASANAAQFPHQINNSKWINEVAEKIVNRIVEHADLPPQSNPFIENVFINAKASMMQQVEFEKNSNKELGESKYWRETGMIEFSRFKDYLAAKNKEVKKGNENQISATKRTF